MKNKIDKTKLPQHLAIIMDGNGRWAKKRGFLRTIGHESGTKSVRNIVECAAELGIPHLTLYAFSTENWSRPKQEVDALMKLLVNSLKKELPTMQKNDISLVTIGKVDRLPNSVYKTLQSVVEQTKNNKRMTLTLALNYGSREEIVNCVKEISVKVKNNLISPDAIDGELINKHLYTKNLPDVDLLIRTSGELRISNFLLWQIAYSELYFTDTLWPDFTKDHLYKAILNYQNRERRFGKISEQL